MSILSHIKFTSIKGHPMVEFHFTEDYPSVLINSKNEKSTIFMTPRCIRTPYSQYYEFFDINRNLFGDDFCNIKVTEDSIEKFYEARPSGKCSTNLTPKFIFNAVNKCENIIVIEPNRGNKYCNSLGMNFPEFERYLYHEDQDEPWKSDEIKAWGKAIDSYEKSYIKEYLTNILDYQYKWLNNQNKSEDEITEAKQIVETYEQNIQNEINKYFSELTEYQTTLPEKYLDCGFTRLYTSDKNILDALDTLIHNNIRDSKILNAKLPDTYMNCSHSYKLLEKLKELSNSDIVHDLYVITILD